MLGRAQALSCWRKKRSLPGIVGLHPRSGRRCIVGKPFLQSIYAINSETLPNVTYHSSTITGLELPYSGHTAFRDSFSLMNIYTYDISRNIYFLFETPKNVLGAGGHRLRARRSLWFLWNKKLPNYTARKNRPTWQEALSRKPMFGEDRAQELERYSNRTSRGHAAVLCLEDWRASFWF